MAEAVAPPEDKQDLKRKASKVKVLVLGDVNLDALIVPLPPEQNSAKLPHAWDFYPNCWRYLRLGGAWLLRDMIKAALVFPADKGGQGDPQSYPEHGLDNTKLYTAFAANVLSSSVLLAPFDTSPDNKAKVYRIERFLGWLHNTTVLDPSNNKTPYIDDLRKRLFSKELTAETQDVLVLHDQAGFFRELGKDILEEAIRTRFDKDQTWIVWQMYSDLVSGDLWDLFKSCREWREKTIVVVKVACLRQAGVNLPDDISLERESHIFDASLRSSPTLKELATCRHLVVHFDGQGVLHYVRENGRLTSSCYFCPDLQDRTSDCAGVVKGLTSLLVAAIVRGITWSIMNHDSPPATIVSDAVAQGVRQGVVLDHLHYRNGYGAVAQFEKNETAKKTYDQLFTPYSQLFIDLAILDGDGNEWKSGGKNYAIAALDLPLDEDLSTWSRIDGFVKRMLHKKPMITIEQCAELIGYKIVEYGLEKALNDDVKNTGGIKGEMPLTPPHTYYCPYETHGVIKTAYRQDIDRFASIRVIMEKYLNNENWKTPLCIAVFGPPGSGKSITIKQILGSINADLAKRPLEFNVSQFHGPDDLAIAFHKVQDESVAGNVPLVFFDEFDTDNLIWLKYFLAPMQDGKFKAGESTYNIGRAIFAFAGGTSSSWHEFYNKRKDELSFKDLKGTDFVSRLRGYIEIASINSPEETVGHVLMFRRAVLLRSLLEKHLPAIFDARSERARINPGVVLAFLKIRCFEHESRSMEAIIQMSRVSDRKRFEKSSLPALEQLKMHVNADKFHELLAEDDRFNAIRKLVGPV